MVMSKNHLKNTSLLPGRKEAVGTVDRKSVTCACIHFHNSCALLDMNGIYLRVSGGMHWGIFRTLCSSAKKKRKKTTNRQTKAKKHTKKQTGHKKAQTATLEGAGEAMDGCRG